MHESEQITGPTFPDLAFPSLISPSKRPRRPNLVADEDGTADLLEGVKLGFEERNTLGWDDGCGLDSRFHLPAGSGSGSPTSTSFFLNFRVRTEAELLHKRRDDDVSKSGIQK